MARLVASGQCDRGIMIDGAGIGSAMTANKVLGVRAAACYSVALAKNSREHNDANVLTLGAGQTSFEQATPIVEMFLTTECVEERHRKRVQLINAVQEGSIEVGPHQATLLAGAGEPRPAPTEPDLEKVAKRVQELLAAQGKPITTPPAESGSEQTFSTFRCTFRHRGLTARPWADNLGVGLWLASSEFSILERSIT